MVSHNLKDTFQGCLWSDLLKKDPQKQVETFLQRGFDVNAWDKHGRTMLHEVTRSVKGTALMGFLIQNGANIEARDSDGWTPLHIAAVNLSYTKMNFLLQNGADLEAKTVYGSNALHLVADHQDSARFIHLLIQKGLDPTDRNKAGQTALEIAYRRNHLKSAKQIEGLYENVYRVFLSHTPLKIATQTRSLRPLDRQRKR